MANAGAAPAATPYAAALWLLALSLACSPASEPTAEPESVYGVQLHLHGSLSEGHGSMEGHNAAAAGLDGAVDVLWWTDHDWRISAYTFVTGFDFESGLQETTLVPAALRHAQWDGREPLPAWRGERFDPATAAPERVETLRTGWVRLPVAHPPKDALITISDLEARNGRQSLRLAATGRSSVWERVSLGFQASRRRQMASLASDARLRLSVLPVAIEGDARLVLNVLLSQHPPDQQSRLDYRISRAGLGAAERSHSVELVQPDEGGRSLALAVIDVPFEPGVWNDLVFELSEDAALYDLGGLDNAMTELSLSLEVRAGGRLEAYVDSLVIERQRVGEPLFEREKEMAREQSERGIANHVGQEISYAAHLNAYGADVPLADPERHPHGYAPAEAVEFAHAHGGIVSLNHFFGIGTKMISHRFPKAQRNLEASLERLIGNRAYGVDLLEVGYRSRGHGVDGFCALWDGLALAGIRLTGVGVSDSHDNHEGWRTGPNNFITWVHARSSSQADLIEGLRAGRAFFGDPTLFRGRMEISDESGGRMGQVVVVPAGRRTLRLLADGLRTGQRIRVVENGEATLVRVVTSASLDLPHEIEVRGPSFLRFEVREDEGPIALSNPIYFVLEGDAQGVSAARLQR